MIWKIVAFIVSRRAIAEWLIRRAMRTPYFHLEGYMSRWWLFNPYGGGSQGEADQADDSARHRRRWPWLPSVRIHHVLREDLADHPHDHPWDARTIILRGWYIERQAGVAARVRRRGDTGSIRYCDFHHIERVSAGGVWTLFITWDYRGSWGFLVGGKKVPWREYEANYERYNPPEETLQLIGKSAHNLNQVIDEVHVGPLARKSRLATDLSAIRLLIDAGHLDKEAAASALLIVQGFERGPLAPPSAQKGEQ